MPRTVPSMVVWRVRCVARTYCTEAEVSGSDNPLTVQCALIFSDRYVRYDGG